MTYVILDGLDLSNQRATNAADPSGATDLATKQYVDNLVAGLSWKLAVRAATTANITLSGTQTVDGVALVVPDRCWVKDQTTGSENGIYNVQSGAWTRASDFDTAAEALQAIAAVEEGTVNADKAFLCVTNAPIVLGTTNLVIAQFGGGTSYSADPNGGLTLTGSQFSVKLPVGSGLVKDSTGLYVDFTAVVKKYSQDVGNASLTTIDVTHTLNTKDVEVTLRRNSDDVIVHLGNIVALNSTTVRLTFPTAPTSAQYRVTVQA